MMNFADKLFNINSSVPYYLDVDASKVIEAVRSTGVTITPAMMHYAHYLISNMKNIGTWQLSSAIYGFVGGTAASHKWNWKDLRDVDSAFRLTFPNGATHDVNGILFNGINQYANTNLNATIVLSNPKTDIHLSAYINGGTRLGSGFPATMGAQGNNNEDAENYSTYVFQRTTLSLFAAAGFNFPTNYVFINRAFSNGYILGNTKSTFIKLLVSGDIVSSSTLSTSGFAANGNIFLGNVSFKANIPADNSYQNIRLGISTIGNGFTDTQAFQQSKIVTNAQAILNRA